MTFLTTFSSNAQFILSSSAPAGTLNFTCAEQSYMFCKALFFGDSNSASLILSTPDPARHKKIGRAVKNFSNYEWDKVKSRAARVGNWYKYTDERNAGMKRVLLATRERELAEASRRDRVWGIGYNEKEAEGRRDMWGENLLGKCLVEVRQRIEREEKEGRKGGEWDGDMEMPDFDGVNAFGMTDGDDDGEGNDAEDIIDASATVYGDTEGKT